MKKRVFIVAAPRSGTTWTMMLLAQHAQVVGIQQNGLIHAIKPICDWSSATGGHGRRILAPGYDRHHATDEEKSTAIYVSDLVAENQLNVQLQQLVDVFFDAAFSAKPGATILLDQTPENMELSNIILNVVPDVYFLHIVRDPRSVYCSMREANRKWAANSFPESPEAASKVWVDYMETAESLKTRTDHYLEIRYEDLLAKTEIELARMWRWLGLSASKLETSSAVERCTIDRLRTKKLGPDDFFRKGQSTGWKKDATRSEIRCVEFVAEAKMQAYGYQPMYKDISRLPVSAQIRRLTRELRSKTRNLIKRTVIAPIRKLTG